MEFLFSVKMDCNDDTLINVSCEELKLLISGSSLKDALEQVTDVMGSMSDLYREIKDDFLNDDGKEIKDKFAEMYNRLQV